MKSITINGNSVTVELGLGETVTATNDGDNFKITKTKHPLREFANIAAKALEQIGEAEFNGVLQGLGYDIDKVTTVEVAKTIVDALRARARVLKASSTAKMTEPFDVHAAWFGADGESERKDVLVEIRARLQLKHGIKSGANILLNSIAPLSESDMASDTFFNHVNARTSLGRIDSFL